MDRNTNVDREKLKNFVDRMFLIEHNFEEAKTERKDLVQDLVAEIKAGADESGVSAAEVKRLTKIRLAEQAAKDGHKEMELDLETYDILYGGSDGAEVDPLS